jgi:hypothetical protein
MLGGCFHRRHGRLQGRRTEVKFVHDFATTSKPRVA